MCVVVVVVVVCVYVCVCVCVCVCVRGVYGRTKESSCREYARLSDPDAP